MSNASEQRALRSLSPQYDEKEHGDYVEILAAELVKVDRHAPRNIALTGHYGSGKSSVLIEVQRRLTKRGIKVINLSLPSLGVGQRYGKSDDDPALNTTNLIQKEIVKQLLYRRTPAKTPASRYNRLDEFHLWPALGRVSVVAAVTTLLGLLFGLPGRVRDAFPPQFRMWLDEHTWGSASTWLTWSSLLIVFIVTCIFGIWVLRLFQQKLRVTELGAGSAKVALSEKSTSFFDEYLDEIVYYFQTSKTTVVIFEDLDRFKDPHIFETLRELNLLLNEAAQTGSVPTKFVYAIRDSIFEQLDAADSEDQAPAQDSDEILRLTSTNRTKFFDLVVPMVPFISHRTSRDLIRTELDKITPDEQRPRDGVVDLVSVHLTDMRLIKNICNEYDVFRRRILREGGLKELNADRLFASIVYKNLYLSDYEEIRFGSSLLDRLYKAYRMWVAQQTNQARDREQRTRIQLRKVDALADRSVQLGERLQAVLMAGWSLASEKPRPTVSIDSTSYEWSQLQDVEFWREFTTSRTGLTMTVMPGTYRAAGVPFSFKAVETLLGMKLSPGAWAEQDRSELQETISSAVESRKHAAHASMTYALEQTGQQLVYEGEEQSLEDVAVSLFGDAELVLGLLKAGFIDENFTLYITQFPGQSISATAMNFILKSVQPDVADIEYRFGDDGDDEARVRDIESILVAERIRLLGGQSVFNIEIFDHLLETSPEQLREPVRRLAASATDDRDFLDAYTGSGRHKEAFISLLSAEWSGVFDYLLGSDAELIDPFLVDAALTGSRDGQAYKFNSEQRDMLETLLPRLKVVREGQTSDVTKAVAHTLGEAGVIVPNLALLAEPLRKAVIDKSSYEVSLDNLRTIMGDDDRLPLDEVKSAQIGSVYDFLLSRLEEYVVVIDELSNVPTVKDADMFAEVLADVAAADPVWVEDIAERAAAGVLLDDIATLDEDQWPSVVGARRLKLTSSNVSQYIAHYGFDTPIVRLLNEADSIVPGEDAASLPVLGLELVNADGLSDEAKVSLVSSLTLAEGSIAASDVSSAGLAVLPDLVRLKLVQDDAVAYAHLQANGKWETMEKLINASSSFVGYMTSLSIGRDELYWIADGDVPDEVKATIFNNIDLFGPNLGPRGASALVNWVVRQGFAISDPVLVLLAEKCDSSGTQAIIGLLGSRAATIELEALKSVLNGVGKPYAQLTTPGRDRPRVPISDSMEAILRRLQSANVVSKYKPNEKRGVFEVSKRRQ